jgi:hypothetical protein
LTGNSPVQVSMYGDCLPLEENFPMASDRGQLEKLAIVFWNVR